MSIAGYSWLAEHLGIQPVQPFRVSSRIGGTRSSTSANGRTQEVFTRHYQPDSTIEAHLTFAFKYEGLHLEFLTRLMLRQGPQFIQDWLAREPASQYARRAGFFYEWLTGKTVPGHDAAPGNYVDAIDSAKYLSATRAQQNRRWRINDNLPGTSAFCPMIRLSDDLALASSLDCHRAIAELVDDYGEEMILRSVNWLTIKESRASFAIEREAGEEDRIHRFASAMSAFCGKIPDPLSEASLTRLQESILGGSTTGFIKGLRRSPVFVGHSERFEPVIDYIAPHHEQTAAMLQGLQAFAERTTGANSILRAAAISFGFVYIHPMADGNGRISRFLINDVLRRDGVLPAPIILPVSAAISANLAARAKYDEVLEKVSTPLMARFSKQCRFNRESLETYPDGVKSNLVFSGWDEAAPTWRYLDLSDHARYMAEVIDRSIHQGMRDEALFLRRFDRAKTALQNTIEGPGEDLDRIIRSIAEHLGPTKSLRKLYPALFATEETAKAITATVLDAFNDVEREDEAPQDVEPEVSVVFRDRRKGG